MISDFVPPENVFVMIKNLFRKKGKSCNFG